MARARNIKPGFFQNEQLGELTPLTRLAFIGMWTIADYRGCVEFRPKRLKIQLLPYDECNIEEIAINLDKSGLIRIYSVQGKRYIKILKFEEWCSTKTPEVVNAESAARRARKINAFPKWADKGEIKKIYTSAKHISKLTGEIHHVDHEIPLNGKNVCGLHVHANLKIIPAKDNLKKSNKFEAEHG